MDPIDGEPAQSWKRAKRVVAHPERARCWCGCAGGPESRRIIAERTAQAGAAKPAVWKAPARSRRWAGVTTVRVGERVMGRCPGHLRVRAMDAAKRSRSSNLAWEEAAAVSLVFRWCTHADRAGTLGRGEWLLVNGISSGVGGGRVAAPRRCSVTNVIGTSGSGGRSLRASRRSARSRPAERVGAFSARYWKRPADAARSGDQYGRRHGVRGVHGVRSPSKGASRSRLRRRRAEGRGRSRHSPREAPQGLRRVEQGCATPKSARGACAASSPTCFLQSQRAHPPLIERAPRSASYPQAKEWMESNRHTGKLVLVMP